MTSINTINSYFTNPSNTKAPSNELGKDAFLKILVTQLQNQDPTAPVKDGEFIGQMAQLSVMEQLTNLNNTFSAFLQSDNHLAKYSNMLDKKVTWFNMQTYEQESGIVTGIKYKDNEVYFTVGDQEIQATAIKSIESN